MTRSDALALVQKQAPFASDPQDVVLPCVLDDDDVRAVEECLGGPALTSGGLPVEVIPGAGRGGLFGKHTVTSSLAFQPDVRYSDPTLASPVGR